jgi:hypothetical protein
VLSALSKSTEFLSGSSIGEVLNSYVNIRIHRTGLTD